MRYPRLIDKKQIGKIKFEAYIIEDDNKLEAFAIYFQSSKKPLLLFQQENITGKIEIKINKTLVDRLQLLKSKDDSLRKEHYKQFQKFVLEGEQVAKEIAFKDKKLHYITDVQLIKSIEQTYLLN
ncbi:hypothetical protein [Sphingobacterium rhinopitheci]|mgnify:CR=1 FL=1|uniref:hypothetical protein n=1 Tax=Sphingobacterium rhinopitheci TaxID=2781960 RepID=UPI001F5183DD|nr:hypothetical protein [Sphingobacterium rhinopitheci]MCI0922631.1 hypothetical protein [Sphingobacterium rhinopitheci]